MEKSTRGPTLVFIAKSALARQRVVKWMVRQSLKNRLFGTEWLKSKRKYKTFTAVQ